MPEYRLEKTAPELFSELQRAADDCRRSVATAAAVVAVELSRVRHPVIDSALKPFKSDDVENARARAREEVAKVVEEFEQERDQARDELQEAGSTSKALKRAEDRLHAVHAVFAALAPDPLDASTGAAANAIEAVGHAVVMGAAMDALQTCQMSGSNAQRARAYERGIRRSKAAIPMHLALVVAAVVLVWLLDRWLSLPPWLQVVIVGSSIFALGADIVNWLRNTFNLRALDTTSD
ncbi:MAG: hypothetical protein R6V19_00505 [Armatimonadota bacterium]